MIHAIVGHSNMLRMCASEKGPIHERVLTLKARVSQMHIHMCQKFEKSKFSSRIPLFRSNLFDNCKNFKNQCIFRGRASPPKLLYCCM